MNRTPTLLTAALAFLLIVPSHAQEPAPPRIRHSVVSAITGRAVTADVLLPPDYDSDPSARFSVLYWLPDAPATNDLVQTALDPAVVHAAIRQRVIPPLIVVYAREGAATWYLNSANGLNPAGSVFALELVPSVDRAFRTLTNRQDRAVQGIGRGGFGAFRFALAHSNLFGSALAYSGTFPSASALATNATLRQDFLEVFGAGFDHAATNHPAFLARLHRDRVRDTTGFRFVVPRQDPRHSENRDLRDEFRTHRIPADWIESAQPFGPQPLPADLALEGLEFAAAWLERSRRPDGDGPWVNRPPTLPPRVRHHTVYSSVLERTVGYSLYLPPGATHATDGLPVAFHLHGRGEDEGRHLETIGYLDSAIRLGEVKPFAWVWLYGGRNSWFMDSADGKVLAESAIREDLIPHIENRWNLGGSPDRRAVDGWGMGAFGAARLASLNPPVVGAALLHNPLLPEVHVMAERFPDVWAAVFNADPKRFSGLDPAASLTRNASALKSTVRFRIVAGNRSPSLPDAQRLASNLESLGYSREPIEVPATAGQGPDLYRTTGLQDLQFISRALHRPRP